MFELGMDSLFTLARKHRDTTKIVILFKTYCLICTRLLTAISNSSPLLYFDHDVYNPCR